MSVGQQTDQYAVHELVLSDDNLANLCIEPLEELGLVADLLIQLSNVGLFHQCLHGGSALLAVAALSELPDAASKGPLDLVYVIRE